MSIVKQKMSPEIDAYGRSIAPKGNEDRITTSYKKLPVVTSTAKPVVKPVPIKKFLRLF